MSSRKGRVASLASLQHRRRSGEHDTPSPKVTEAMKKLSTIRNMSDAQLIDGLVQDTSNGWQYRRVINERRGNLSPSQWAASAGKDNDIRRCIFPECKRTPDREHDICRHHYNQFEDRKARDLLYQFTRGTKRGE